MKVPTFLCTNLDREFYVGTLCDSYAPRISAKTCEVTIITNQSFSDENIFEILNHLLEIQFHFTPRQQALVEDTPENAAAATSPFGFCNSSVFEPLIMRSYQGRCQEVKV